MLTNEFIEICKTYSKTHDDVIYECVEDDKKLCRYTIEFFRYIVEFRYVKKESTFIKKSSLYCVIKLNKNSQVYYHLPDIIPYLSQKNFEPCYFGLIENKERLKNCFNSLTNILDSVLSQIEPYIEGEVHLRSRLFEFYKKYFSLKEGDIDFSKIDIPDEYDSKFFAYLQKNRDGLTFSRFFNFAPYALLLKNKHEKALKKYEKLRLKDQLYKYEECLIDYIKKPESEALKAQTDMDSELKFMAFSSHVKTFLIVTAIASVLFCGFFAIFNFILSCISVVHLSAPWYIGILCAMLCGVFGAIAFFQYVPNKYYNKKEMKEYADLFISKPLKICCRITFVVSVILAVVFAVLIAQGNVLFYEKSIKFNSKEYTYSQIDSVYYIDARYNDYDERIERGSYVILFKDKTSLDLDGSTTVKYSKEKVVPLLKEKGYDVKYADSERELPWYTE
jgi:hypothetical protein